MCSNCSGCRTVRPIRTSGTPRRPCPPRPRPWATTSPLSTPPTVRTSRPTWPRSTPRCSRGSGPSPASAPATGGGPVADYLLQAMGVDNLTPFQFQADIMNGTDPTPQDVTLENGFFSKHKVKAFVYNQQVVDSLTESVRANAQKAGVPVVGVYETMPVPGYDYQSWMLA